MPRRIPLNEEAVNEEWHERMKDQEGIVVELQRSCALIANGVYGASSAPRTDLKEAVIYTSCVR